MYRVSTVLLVAVSCSVTAAILLGQQEPAKRAPHPQTMPAPTGRTLDDVRAAYTPPQMESARARSVAETPPPPPRPPRIVEAEVFALTDRQGNVRAELGACETGAKMQMFDARGKVRLVLAEISGVATVTLVGEDGRTGLELRLTPDGDAMVGVGPRGAESPPRWRCIFRRAAKGKSPCAMPGERKRCACHRTEMRAASSRFTPQAQAVV